MMDIQVEEFNAGLESALTSTKRRFATLLWSIPSFPCRSVYGALDAFP